MEFRNHHYFLLLGAHANPSCRSGAFLALSEILGRPQNYSPDSKNKSFLFTFSYNPNLIYTIKMSIMYNRTVSHISSINFSPSLTWT